jgi:hypothetical protein
MSIPRNINPGAAPLLWSTIEEAFRNINQNFTDLYATVADDGSTQVVNFANLSTDVSPSLTEIYDLGAPTRRWKDLYLAGNSLYLGSAVITATGNTVNLPVGSTIGGLRLDESYFKTFAVSGQDSVVADEGTDTLTLASGTGVSISTNAATDTVTFTNSGVTSITGSTGISTSAPNGAITLSNTGVTSIVAGFGMSVNSATGAVTVTNEGLAGLDAGIGITLSARDPLTGTVTVSNSSPNVPQDTFRSIAVPGQSSVVADSISDILTITSSGGGLSITTDDATDTVTFSNTGVHSLAVSNGLTIDAGTGAINLILDAVLNRDIIGNITGDITGSVFADDSTPLVDATNGAIVGNVVKDEFTITTGDNEHVWTFGDNGSLTFPDDEVQTTAYAGGVGHMMMIDTNRTDTYTEIGTSDKPFKTFAAAIAAAEANPATAFTFVMMGCTISEDVDFTGTTFTQITISTACRSVITGNITIASIPTLSQLIIRNIEIGGTFTLTGDGTSEQMNSCSFYNVSFTGAVNITATNASAFYEVAFFSTVNFTNLSYLYINGAQFNTDWTITADSDGVIPSRGINPGTGGSIAIVFSVIANNVIFVKGGTAAYVFQPHMSRMGLGAGTYTVPVGWTMTPHSTVLRGTWVNNGTVAMRNSSSDLAITGVARSYTGIIGGDRVVADLVPANSTGAAGDAAGMIAVGGGYLYVCTANWASPGTADIWTRTLLTTGAW